MLPGDQEALEAKQLKSEEFIEAGFNCVVIKDYPLPPGYNRKATDLLIRLPAGYPDAAPDMFWCDPPVRLASTGGYPVAADQMEPHGKRSWQRFSRHLQPTSWRPGSDNLNSYLSLVARALRESVIR